MWFFHFLVYFEVTSLPVWLAYLWNILKVIKISIDFLDIYRVVIYIIPVSKYNFLFFYSVVVQLVIIVKGLK